MNKNRLMIRLIDVALIILLGFIAISRLKTEYVDLPGGNDSAPPPTRIKSASLQIYGDAFILEDGGRKNKVRALEELENTLINRNDTYRRQGTKMVLNIEPKRSSIVQNLVDVIDICQRNQIEKTLNYDSVN